jgi:pyridoxal phosphate enzyme (YggS family)
MRDSTTIKENIDSLRLRMEGAATRAGRPVSEISLMAVTKFQPIEAVFSAYAAGIRLFGENRVQEACSKYGEGAAKELPGSRLDLIGQLQRNKINKALEVFDSIQSVGSLELLEAILDRSRERERSIGLYLELHTGEETKSGFACLDDLLAAVERFLERKNANGSLKLKGLMTMAPFTGERNVQRKAFKALAEASREIKKRFDITGFDELSMGMSSDFESAIEEGSTMVRIGTAIFGAREQI